MLETESDRLDQLQRAIDQQDEQSSESEGECDMEMSPADPATGSPLSVWGTRGRGMRT